MPAHQLAVRGPKPLQRRQVLLRVEHVPGQAHEVLGLAAGLRQDFQDIFQRLPELPGKRSIEPFAPAAPADLPADENQPALAGNPVGEALRPRPARRLEDLHSLCLSLKRCSWPVSVRGKASTNCTTRGYLYGAMLLFT